MNIHHLNLTVDGKPIPDSEWEKPLYFRADTKRPHESWGPIAQTNCPLYGWIPSLFIGTHVGWKVNGVDYPLDAFEEISFPGDYTGACPVGLIPKVHIDLP